MDKLSVVAVIEILGRPAEHVTEALTLLVKKISLEKGMKVVQSKINEPILAQDSKDIFTAFAEVSLELDSVSEFLGFVFGYMPSHLELVYPEKVSFTNSDLNVLVNKLTQRLHEYDAIVKTTMADKETILKKLYEVAPHLFKQINKLEKKKVKKSASKSKKKK